MPFYHKLGDIPHKRHTQFRKPNGGLYREELMGLEGFSGIGHSVEDCLFKAKWGMKEHVELLKEQGLPVPPTNPAPRIVIQNERKEAAA